MKTTDGYTITTVEQDGSLAGEELGRVFLLRENGYDWWGCGSVQNAAKLAALGEQLSRREFVRTADKFVERRVEL